MFSFNGTYRIKPEQSLGGANKKEARDELVQRAAEDREKRNHFKRNTISAIKIQACYRSHRSRHIKKCKERVLFDELQTANPHHGPLGIQTLGRKLNFFFNPSLDQDALRLIFLSQLIIKKKQDLITLIIGSNQGGEVEAASSLLYLIKKLLKYNCRLISSLYKHPAIPVRFIEVFTSPLTYGIQDPDTESPPCFNHPPQNHHYKHQEFSSRNANLNTSSINSFTKNTNMASNPVNSACGFPMATTNHEDVTHDSRKICHLLFYVKKYLLQNGYFPTIISLTNQRIPCSLTRSDDVTRISMATTIRDMLLRFVIIPDEGADEEYNQQLVSRLVEQVLCMHLSPQKSAFILPILITPRFPYTLLLYHLSRRFKTSIHTNKDLNPVDTSKNTSNNIDNGGTYRRTDPAYTTTTSSNHSKNSSPLTTPPNATTPSGPARGGVTSSDPSNLFLLHSLMELGSPHFSTFQADDFHNFLSIVSSLVPSLEPCSHGIGNGVSEEEEEEEEASLESCMEWTADANHSSQLEQLKQRCIDLLGNSSSLSSSLLTPLSNGRLDDSSLVSLCKICYAVLHFGRSKIAAFKTKIFNSIAFNSAFLERSWTIISTIHTTNILNEESPLLQLISRGVSLCNEDLRVVIPLLSVFSTTFNHFLLTVSDAEFHGDSGSSGLKAFSNLATVSKVALSLRDCCLGIIELTHPESKFSIKKIYPHQQQHQSFSFSSPSLEDDHSSFLMRQRLLTQTFKEVVKLVKQLYERDCRRPFCPRSCWLTSNHIIQSDKLVQSLSDSAIECIGSPFGTLSILNSDNPDLRDDAPQLSNSEVRKLIVLSELPFIIPFVNRVEIFHDLVRRERHEEPMETILNTNTIMIRRNFLYEDAFEKLSYENEPNLKKRLKMRLINAAGLDEAGVDGGGLFREFMGELVIAGFDPNRGFFRTTPDKLHYPNPQSKVLYPQDYLQHFYFLGRILGKVIYEEMLIEVPFASFFLCKLLSRADLDIHHLASLDPLMHRNLLFIKDFNGDVSDLQLNFTATYDNLGVVATDELKVGGENIPVTNQNRFEYVHLMADYRLNKQIRQHSQAFRRGLGEVVPMQWLQLFDHKELQVLLSGADTPIDVADLRRNTLYSGGYTEEHAVIGMFWKVVGDFSNLQKQMLLKFVTSCSRAPLLGFKDLYPAFCIQMAGQDLDRLPTSSTCMNLLKLPEFHDVKVLKNKLVYALESGSGFELS